MTTEEEEIYDDGYSAYQSGDTEEQNPFLGTEAEFWSDGWSDAEEDDVL